MSELKYENKATETFLRSAEDYQKQNDYTLRNQFAMHIASGLGGYNVSDLKETAKFIFELAESLLQESKKYDD